MFASRSALTFSFTGDFGATGMLVLKAVIDLGLCIFNARKLLIELNFAAIGDYFNGDDFKGEYRRAATEIDYF